MGLSETHFFPDKNGKYDERVEEAIKKAQDAVVSAALGLVGASGGRAALASIDEWDIAELRTVVWHVVGQVLSTAVSVETNIRLAQSSATTAAMLRGIVSTIGEDLDEAKEMVRGTRKGRPIHKEQLP